MEEGQQREEEIKQPDTDMEQDKSEDNSFDFDDDIDMSEDGIGGSEAAD